MDLAANRFGKTWKHFLEVLKVDYNCSLADVAAISIPLWWYEFLDVQDGAIGVKQAKADVVRDYYGGVEPPNRQLPLLHSLKYHPPCCRKKSLVLPGSQSPLTVEPPFRSNGPHPVVLLKCCAITKERREIHVFSNISQSILSVPGLCSYEPWH